MIRRFLLNSALCVFALAVGGCIHPLSRDISQRLREQLTTSYRTYRDAVSEAPTITTQHPPSPVEQTLSPDRIEHLDQISGTEADRRTVADFGPDLMGRTDRKVIQLSLEQAVKRVVKNNLDIKLARLVPAVRDVQITQAEAVFDAAFFANINQSKLDTPRPASAIVVFGSQQTQRTSMASGFRKLLATGGQMQIETQMNRVDERPSFFATGDEEFDYYDVDITLTLQQPLLRNFGSDVTQSQILLSTNAREQAMYDLMDALGSGVASAEQAYWELVFAYHLLLINQRLLTESEKARDIVVSRQIFDADSEQVAQMNRFVAERHRDVIDARFTYGQASNQLKALVYSSKLPLAGEEVIEPIDTLSDQAFTFNLSEAITTALQHRPDLARALSEIGDATIRQRVADNQRLPILDLSATMTYSGISPASLGTAYDELTEGDFIDYILGLQFEMPLGNRAGEAAWQQRNIERDGAVINYRRLAHAAVNEIKTALRRIEASYRSISLARDARRASAEVVRVQRVRLDVGQDLTPEFIDRNIRNEEMLARNEAVEVRARADYHIAIARFYESLGTILEHYGIELIGEPTL